MITRNELEALQKAGIIDTETATKIEGYYASKKSSDSFSNKVILIVGILATLLVGFGIIFIFAHNWDQFSITAKTIIAFIPMIATQVLYGMALTKKKESVLWKETTSVALFLGVGACLSLISQTYQLQGSLTSFLLLWLTLTLPMFYLYLSKALFVVYSVAFFFTSASALNTAEQKTVHLLLIWGIFFVLSYCYYKLLQAVQKGPYVTLINLIMPILFAVCLMIHVEAKNYLHVIWGLFALSSLYITIGYHFNLPRYNGFKLLGFAGYYITLLILSSAGGIENYQDKSAFDGLVHTPEFLMTILLLITNVFILFFKNKARDFFGNFGLCLLFLAFAACFLFFIDLHMIYSAANGFILLTGIFLINQGRLSLNLSLMNLGMLVISLLIISKIFDSSLSFSLKGFLFIIVGICFYMGNYLLLKELKSNPKN